MLGRKGLEAELNRGSIVVDDSEKNPLNQSKVHK